MLSTKYEVQAFFQVLVGMNSFRTATGDKGKNIIMNQNGKGLNV